MEIGSEFNSNSICIFSRSDEIRLIVDSPYDYIFICYFIDEYIIEPIENETVLIFSSDNQNQVDLYENYFIIDGEPFNSKFSNIFDFLIHGEIKKTVIVYNEKSVEKLTIKGEDSHNSAILRTKKNH